MHRGAGLGAGLIDPKTGWNHRGALFRVDPETGYRKWLSQFGVLREGPLGALPNAVAVEASGAILVVEPGLRTDRGRLFRIDPFMGTRTILSNFNDGRQGPLGADPVGVAVMPAVPPAVAGCVEVDGGPVIGAAVRFTQPDETARSRVTDAEGCFRFNTAVSGTRGTLTITLPEFP